ncbi:16S rRNA (guanine(527)-N(7))-methyltransferase RsmG [Rhodovastum atsumiense]|uniref:16S rRNA (guanine(527)-N(7))-methyltransferase RsmG n=1 Tax=Rhodovastum atsumiense TaxID=504468 RepID=UPI001EEFEA3C|nr:16S rRNA (guanine(527)-N(7))-methyltransferase RsmG [Rhodovastum atsumiense]
MKHAPTEIPGVSRETRERLDLYAETLLRWNRTINLISRHDEAEFWQRHIVDCLQLAPLVPAGISHAIDLGSGGGLPGLVLAIVTGIPFHLVEADQRKAAFLREAARRTAAPATVHATRIEAVTLPPAPLVTARALAPLPTLLGWSHPLLASGGVCLFLKGRSVDDELTAASAEWHMTVERTPSRTDTAASILRISEIDRVRNAP